jgi:ATP synthase protein I
VLIAVLLQAAITVLAGIIAWLIWGPLAGLSLVAGGSAIALPNALLAIRLKMSRPESAPMVLLIGEFVKIGLSVLLLWAASQWIVGLSWGALIVGVILALKVLLLTPWVQSVADRRSAAQAVLAHQSTKSEL